jgi:hypothetical protein
MIGMLDIAVLLVECPLSTDENPTRSYQWRFTQIDPLPFRAAVIDSTEVPPTPIMKAQLVAARCDDFSATSFRQATIPPALRGDTQ